MISAAPKPTLASLWKQTQGTPEERTRSLIRLASDVPAIAHSPLLAQIRGLARDGTFDRVPQIFGSESHASRPHNVKADGMRAGGFTSVHQVTVREPEASTEVRLDPPDLGYFELYCMSGILSEAQRDWCVRVSRGERAPFPPPVPIRTPYMLKQTAMGLEQVVTALVRPSPQAQALLQCAIANLVCPQTQTTVAKTLRDGELTARTHLLRATEIIDSLNERKLPSAAMLVKVPSAQWWDAMWVSDTGKLANEAAREAYVAGSIERASILLRIGAKFGADLAYKERMMETAHLIANGAFLEASRELRFLPAEPVLDLAMVELGQPYPRISAVHFREIEERYPVLAASIRERGQVNAAGTVVLRPPQTLDADTLIARGRAAMPTVEMTDVELQQAMFDLQGMLLKRGGEAELVAASVTITTRARLVAKNADRMLEWGLRMLRGRGAGIVRGVISAAGNPEQSSGMRAIDVSDVVDTENAARNIFHELGHAAEQSDMALRHALEEWRDRREGNFISPYVDRRYSDGATEVFSMGFENFCNPITMAEFYRQDDEHFALILGYLLT